VKGGYVDLTLAAFVHYGKIEPLAKILDRYVHFVFFKVGNVVF
jgi:hypothetical protein